MDAFGTHLGPFRPLAPGPLRALMELWHLPHRDLLGLLVLPVPLGVHGQSQPLRLRDGRQLLGLRERPEDQALPARFWSFFSSPVYVRSALGA